MSYVYSFDDESWVEDIIEVLQNRVDCSEEFDEDGHYRVSMFRADSDTPSVSRYLPSILGCAQELALEECFESQTNPFDYSKEEEKELQGMVESLVEAYCKGKGIDAGFFFVNNVKRVEVKFYVDDGCVDGVEELTTSGEFKEEFDGV